ncbi:tRNA dihydrouridine synthase DusB [Canibacter sp. lx-72]|uniref:tRNA dihydrouridine synthase DusB n=1 Tax=Canibacter zhuwentaonis TaxID=2837491 RepID=UPI001BDD98DF|nr:tRNA dihydrouridine synthase DusB [Canibacter zhuwentaonis]MBT1018470.1 tRNA dihydrouridine synthase DusB [Canibacter zhuwentaonis]
MNEICARPLKIGELSFDIPVELAPMAGITNTAYRRLCREYGAGVFVSEMITSRALVERTPGTMRLIQFHSSETPRSLQLYGVDPVTIAKACKIIVDEDLADHIDLNFGCPVPKVTRSGGGAALPWKQDLFASIVQNAVKAAGHLPLTIKMRKGIDSSHLTFLDAGKMAVDAGVAAIALHARTAAEHYSGQADWDAITELKNLVSAISDIPVLGNGDIWCAADALKMVGKTGCDGVVVGRGCLGRPWLFGDLEAVFRARRGEITFEQAKQAMAAPNLGVVMQAVRRHTELLIEFFGGDEAHACRDIRKHMAWYFKGYGVGGEARRALATVTSLAHMDDIFATMDAQMSYPGAGAEGQRGRAGRPKTPKLPEGWLESRSCESVDFTELADAERDDSGG